MTSGDRLRPRIARRADRLACPLCRAPIAGAEGLACRRCGRRFETRDGVPILLARPAQLPIDVPRLERDKARYLRRPWLRRLLYPSMANTSFQRREQRRFLDGFAAEALILDLGSSLTAPDPRALRLDIVFSANLDVVGDAQAIPFLDDSADGILCTGLLEHVQRPEKVVAEIRRVLRPGGRVYAAAPFIQGYHPSPTDFRRYTREGLRQLFESFEIESLRNSRGSGSAVAWILSDFLTELLSFGRPGLYRMLGVPIRWACLPLKYLDVWLVENRFDHFATSGFTVEARKPEAVARDTPPISSRLAADTRE